MMGWCSIKIGFEISSGCDIINPVLEMIREMQKYEKESISCLYVHGNGDGSVI